MKAACWMGKEDIQVLDVPDPRIINPRDVVVRITRTAICGSDLHLYNGFMPTMMAGDIVGHEFMGEVVDKGPEVKKLNIGDRVCVPFTIACGNCYFCKSELWSLCDNTNPNAWIAEEMMGYTPSGLFGYTHMMGGYAGGQAQYARVPHADTGCLKIPAGIPDEKVLFLTDIFPTGYQAAEQCGIQPGDVVAIWGCGPVGQFAIRSAYLLGASRVIAIDRFEERLRLAVAAKAEVLNYEELPHEDVVQALKNMTGGRGPDRCIDAVGMEAHAATIPGLYDVAKQKLRMSFDRPTALRQAIMACRKGGTLSVPGVYGGLLDKIPFGAAMNKALTFRMGQTHMMRYMQPLLDRILNNEIDPSEIISHRVAIDDVPDMYKTFRDKEDKCIKVVIDPWAERKAA
jgi:threonine dehydrogenase-like Zn-dependent dehydrogenase